MATRDLVRRTAPYIRKKDASVQKMMYDVIIALLPTLVFVIYKYQLYAISILIVSLVAIVGTEYLFYKIRKEPSTISNGSAIITALIYALIMPDNSPLWAVFIGGVVAVLVCKLAFGGLGANIFNIAGFGRVFTMVSFGALLAYNFTDTNVGTTTLEVLNGNSNLSNVSISISDMVFGINEVGSLGELNAICILLGLVYLLLRRSIDWRIPLTFFVSFIGLSMVGGFFYESNHNLTFMMDYTLIHLFSGGVIFGAVFMVTDPITSPTTGPGRVYYAFGVAALTYFIRVFGAYPEGVVFAILIMNMFVPAIDYYKWSFPRFRKRAVIVFSLIVLFTVTLLYLGVR